MERSFVFYENFEKSIEETLEPEERAAAYMALCKFALHGMLPEDKTLKMMCLMSMPSTGKKVGAPVGNQNAKKGEETSDCDDLSENNSEQSKTMKNNSEQSETMKNNSKQLKQSESPFINEKRETRNEKQETRSEKGGCKGECVADASALAPDDFFDDESSQVDCFVAEAPRNDEGRNDSEIDGGGDEAEQIPKDAKPCRFEASVFFIPIGGVQKSPVPFSWEAQDMGFDWQDICDEYTKFRDFWLSVPGAKGVKKDWLATWRNWLRRSKEWKSERQSG